MNFMQCQGCKCIVQINATGVCLGCQKGFIGIPQEDAIDLGPKKTLDDLQDRQKEIENALKERKDPESDQFKHKGVKAKPKTTQTSRCNSSIKSKWSKEKD